MATVLVVDDSVTERRLAAGLLAKNPDLTVLTASNGHEALVHLAGAPIDLVVTDLMMPEMNGLELVRAIRQQYPQVPVVLMTGQGTEELAVQALQCGASSYVPKRMLSVELCDTVRRVVSASRDEHSQTQVSSRLTQFACDFELENDLNVILPVPGYLQRVLRALMLFDEVESLRVSVAIEEALVNAYYHGNLEIGSDLREVNHEAYYELARQRCDQPPYRDRKIHFHVEFTPTVARYVVRDDGPGYDPRQLPDPTIADNFERPCGRGLLLMRTFMDEVHHNAVGNEVTLIKRRAAAG